MTLQSSAYMHLAFPSCYGVGNKARLYRDTIIPSWFWRCRRHCVHCLEKSESRELPLGRPKVAIMIIPNKKSSPVGLVPEFEMWKHFDTKPKSKSFTLFVPLCV